MFKFISALALGLSLSTVAHASQLEKNLFLAMYDLDGTKNLGITGDAAAGTITETDGKITCYLQYGKASPGDGRSCDASSHARVQICSPKGFFCEVTK